MIDDQHHWSEHDGGTIPDAEHTLHAGATPKASATDSGWVLAERYRVLEVVGSGGAADVFRSRDELLRRDVAVKVFRTIVDMDGNPGGSERQAIELQALAGLNHPNLITLFDASITGSPAFLVMELVDGPSLADRLEAGPIPEAYTRDIGTQIADALSYVHARAMVHRDVKPANILLGADGTAGPGTTRARLSDFGIVRLLGSERMTGVELTVGTASYLAPEQVRGADVGTEADIYSLGLVLLESLTGIRSFDGPPIEAAMARLTRSPEIPTALPVPWPTLLAAMTAADPTARPDAAQVADALRNPFAPRSLPVAMSLGAATDAVTSSSRRLVSAGGTAALAAQDATKLAQPMLRRRGALVVLALALAGVIGSAAWVLAQPASQSRTPPGVVTTTPAKPGLPVAPADNTHGSQQVTHAISASATTSGIRIRPTSRPAPSRSTSSTTTTTASAAPSTTPTPTPTPTGSTQPTGTDSASGTTTAPTSAVVTISGAG